MRSFKPLVLLAAALAVLVACGSDGGGGMHPTITIKEANRKAEEHVQRALAVLPEQAKLTNPSIFEDMPCDDPSDQGPKGRVIASHGYQIERLDPDKIPTYFDTLKAWWQDNGYRVLDNNPRYEFLWVEDVEDSFRVTLKSNPKGELYIGASSPCVWPEGTPAPE